MKTTSHLFNSPKSEIKQKRTSKFNWILFLLFSLVISQNAIAQNANSTLSISDKVTYWVFGGLCLIFSGIIIYALTGAVKVLKENGKSLDLTFPIFRSMANNGKIVGFFVILAVAIGILCAVKFN